jgi:hypothetical protein
LDLAGSPLKARKFKAQAYETDDLYRWSSLRSAYLAEANLDLGAMYAANQWGRWNGTDWYWDPWYDTYTFVPDDGICFSPFGWGFFSPFLVFEAPFFGDGDFDRDDGVFRRGGRTPFHHVFTTSFRTWGARSPYLASNNYAHGIYHGPGSSSPGGGFHSGTSMAGVHAGGSGGGGSHGGGGGFHGGGGGGGFGGGGFGGFHR